MIATKAMDPVMGVDVHIIQPPGPVPPVPIPHPFIGMLIDPMDFAPIIGSTVMVNGMPRATAGTGGMGVPPHIPIGGVFVKPPANECEIFMGSATVLADGEPLGSLGMPCLSCHDVGMPPPPRLKKKRKPKSMALPTSVVLAVPAGMPVMVGGPPTISMMAIGMKVAMAGLGKAFKKLKKTKAFKKAAKKLKKAKQKAFKNMKPGFLKCKVLKAEPVNVVSGAVDVDQFDFEVPWRIPLRWTRHYSSDSTFTGVCGRGWETPADARLVIDGDGIVAFHDGSAGAAVFPGLPDGEPMPEITGGAVLDHEGDGLVVRTANGRSYSFLRENAQRDPADPRGVILVANRVSDRFGNSIEFVRTGTSLEAIRSSCGAMISVTSVGGRIQRMTLHHPGEAPRALITCEYLEDQLIVVRDALGHPYSFQYDAGRMVRHTDRNGLSFYYAYAQHGDEWKCVRAWGDGGLYTYAFEYGDGWTRSINSQGAVWLTEHYNSLPVRETDPSGAITSYEYDDAGRTSMMTDPLGRRTLWKYDDAGNLLALIRPDGSKVVAEYDDEGQPVALTDPGGNAMKFEYDRGRMISRTGPNGGKWTYRYDAGGGLIEAVDPLGAWTRIERDRFGFVVGAGTGGTESGSGSHAHSGVGDWGRGAGTGGGTGTGAGWVGVRFVRDGLGAIVERIGESGERSSYTYDTKGRLLEAVYASGARVRCEYDASDNLIAYTDENGHTTRLRYAGLGEVAEVLRPDGSIVRYERDSEERLVRVVNERGATYRIDRDLLGRVVREVDYWGGARVYEYDMAGDIAAMINALGERVDIERDVMGRVVRRVLPDGSSDVYRYDTRGNVVEARNAVAHVLRAYDADGNIVREALNGVTVQSEYDLAGRRVRRTSSLGHVIDIEFDDAGRTSGIMIDDEPLSVMQYGAHGRLEHERLGEHLSRSYSYDNAGRLERQRLMRGAESIAEQSFSYDAAGQLAMRRVDDVSDVFEYDPVGRIRQFTSTVAGNDSLAGEFDYDATGDLLRPTSAALAQGEVRAASWNGVTYFYDAAGRVVRKRTATGELHFRWNALDQLVSSTTASGDRVEFEYDPFGRRTRKVAASHSTRFTWDGDWLFAEQHGNSAPREFVYRPYTFEPIASVNGSISFFETDTVGAPHAMYDTAGTRTWHGHYDALGQVTTTTIELDANPFRLQGQYHDPETGLAYNRHRYYDADTGSFLSQDPMRLAAGPNPYRYGPSVWNWIDVFGLDCKTVRVYRVEGPGNARVNIDAAGNVSIPNKDRMLHVSFDNPAHAEYFLNKTHARGHTDNVIKSFEVPEDVVKDIQSRAVKQSDAKKFPGAPQIDDPSVSKELGMPEKDVLGVKGADIEALEQNAVPGSGKVH